MKTALRVALDTSAAQAERLRRLQAAFSEVCNALAPIVQQTRCWNRVALHHMTYKGLRERFPAIGSQMICNAIYSVSRASRHVYQHPSSPFNVGRDPARSLPLLRFQPQAPVYFDRHTLSLKNGQVSLYTLDGRMKFTIGLDAEDERRFHTEKLREIVLTGSGERFYLSFHFSPGDDEAPEADAGASADLPEYLLVLDPQIPAAQAAAPIIATQVATS